MLGDLRDTIIDALEEEITIEEFIEDNTEEYVCEARFSTVEAFAQFCRQIER